MKLGLNIPARRLNWSRIWHQHTQFDRIGFLLFTLLIATFFVLPDPQTIQKPFRIGVGFFFALLFLTLIINQQVRLKILVPILISGAIVAYMAHRGTLQSSFINAWLCFIGILLFPKILFKLTPNKIFSLHLIHFIAMASIILQFFYFSSADGRPSMGYEINLSGAYLFLFFLLSDVLDRKDGKILVIGLSFFLLSRLLLFSILLFYIIKIAMPYFSNLKIRLKFSIIAIITYIFLAIFSVWYVANIQSTVSYDTGISRLLHLNDGSNQWRFFTNTLVMAKMALAPLDPNVLFGFGPIENFLKGTKGSLMMPHNELFDAIAEFGIVSVIFFCIFHIQAV